MEVDVNCKSVVKIDVNSEEAFKLLAKTLHMDFILDENITDKLYVRDNGDGELSIYDTSKHHDELFDDRGELYNALMATARCIFVGI